jgi:predicted permease
MILEQVLILFAFVALGFFVSKTGLAQPSQSKILSSILVNVILPFNALKTFWGNFTVQYLSSNYALILLSLLLLAVIAVASFFGGRLFSRQRYEQQVCEYTLVVPNMGYMGYPLAEAMFGTAGLMDFMMFAIPINFYIYLYAYPILTKTKMSWKALANPAIVAMFVGMILGVTGVPMPDLVADIMDKGSACMGPISMLLTGIVVSEYDLKAILGDAKVYILSALRLLVIPAVIGAVLMPFVQPEVLRIAVLLYALPCGLNTVVFPNLVNEDCKLGAGLAMVSHCAVCLTIPLIFWIFGL